MFLWIEVGIAFVKVNSSDEMMENEIEYDCYYRNKIN